jgi:hypothetical protein
MAQYASNKLLHMLSLGTIDLSSVDIRAMLVNNSFVWNPDISVVDDGGAACAKAKELTAAGYARQTLSAKVLARDDVNDMIVLTFADLNFGSPVAGQTIGGLILFKFNAVDTSAEVLGFYDTVDIPTAGIPIVMQCPSAGAGGGIKVISG